MGLASGRKPNRDASAEHLRLRGACRRIARDLELLHAGIDLRETPDGDWYCFEVNPCPGFLYYERQTGQPISTALAELLHSGVAAVPKQTGVAALR